MIVCDRDTCANSDRRDALEVLASSEDFVANLLHLKCKVVQLARRQMLKESTRWHDRSVNAELGRIVGPASTNVEQVPRINSVNEGHQTVDHASESIQSSEGVSAEVVPDQLPGTICHWTEMIFTNFSLCWTILAVGILCLAVLISGVLLGAFVCTHGSHNLPGFFRLNTRIGRAVY